MSRRVASLALAALACSATRVPPGPRLPEAADERAPEPSRPPDQAFPPTQDLPPPLPVPALAAEPHPIPGDPLELLWGHRLDFSGGAPLVTIRLLEGQEEISFSPRGAGRVEPRGGDAVSVPAGAPLRARARATRPATLSHEPLLAQFESRDRSGLERARATWEGRGVRTRVRAAGGIYGIAGRVIDNRRSLLLAEGEWTRGVRPRLCRAGL